MKSIRIAAIVCTGLVLMLIGDAPPEYPLRLQMVPQANAILGVRFCSIEVMRNAAEILAYGTAAVVEDGVGSGEGA